MSLGFSVAELLPRARGGGVLKMGLCALEEGAWLDPAPDRAARRAGFTAFSEGVQVLPEGVAAARELARVLGVEGDLRACAEQHWEDFCLLTRRDGEEVYRLVAAAVVFPSDWRPADKLGLPLTAIHAPIHGYPEQLASGVNNFMAQLTPGRIFGRCNWFITPTDAWRWVAGRPKQAFAHVTPANAGETLFVRCERQTLRRLPMTGAIVFTIGVYLSPLGRLPAPQIAMLANAVTRLLSGEGARRGAPAYAAALEGFARARGIAIGQPQ